MEQPDRSPALSLDREVLEELDACRPSSADASSLSETTQRLLRDDPRYAAWFEQSQAFDTEVAATYADVPVPEGLAGRLQSALTADAASLNSAALPMPARVNRRGWLAAAGAALATTAAGWGVVTWWRGRQQDMLTTDEILHAMLTLHQQTAEQRASGVSMAKQAPPSPFPFSSHVHFEVTPRWRTLSEPLLGRNGVAYELTAPAAPRAVLYVLSLGGDRGAPGLPPLTTDSTAAPSTTGGCSMGMWREDDRMVVLVVDGDERRYRAFVERPAVFA